ncbi:MAG: BamA/TamA family outer membrane protein [Ignavibacteriae bacterium]|nr:BamA/TamA family outer membrane protein [Ignavibacteriota bacterium]
MMLQLFKIQKLKKYFLFLFILLSLQTIYAQKIIQLNISGNENISAEKYQNWIDENKLSFVKMNEDSILIPAIKEKLFSSLMQNGYFNSKINFLTVDTTSLKPIKIINLNVEEGKQTTIRKIEIKPGSELDLTLQEKYFASTLGNVFYQSELQSQIDKILVELENKGFPFASIKIESLVFDSTDGNCFVDINLKLETNRLSTIEKIEIEGNTKTKKSVILNTIRINRGSEYSQNKIDEIPILLNRLRFFDPVEKPTYYLNSKEEGILKISLKEKSTNNFDGIIGYVPASKTDDKGYFTGFVNISLRNIFGTGRGAGIKWQQENQNTQELQIKYLEPWVLNFPVNLNLHLFQRKQDSSYVKRIYGGNLDYLATENITASLIVESESVIPSENNISIQNSNSLNSGFRLQLDYRDDIFVPQSGIYFSTSYKFKSKTENASNISNLNIQEYDFDFAIYYSIFKRQVIALGVHAKEMIGDSFNESDYFRIGGSNSLRGYREQQFLGNRVLWSNLEYRFLLSLRSYVFLFYDLGYYLQNENEIYNVLRNSEYKSGYGLGLSIETALGIMRVGYALAAGNSFSDGLIHFGLVNDF